MENVRTKEQINQDYNLACATIGDRYFRVGILNNEIIELNNKLVELNKEANELAKLEKSIEESVKE